MMILLLLLISLVDGQTDCPHELPNMRLWSNDAGWTSGQKPVAGEAVTITDLVLLDESTPRLDHITIETGGRLVWSPAGDYTMTTRYLLIKGRFDIGAETCPFPPDVTATITLTGIRLDGGVDHFGEKFIGVDAGGTLEIHGAPKLSWTKLTETLPKLDFNPGLIYHYKSISRDSEALDNFWWRNGIHVHVFDAVTAQLVDYEAFHTGSDESWGLEWEHDDAAEYLAGIADGYVVSISTFINTLSDLADKSIVEDAIEVLAFGQVTDTGLIRQLKTNDAFVMLMQKGSPSTVLESRGENIGFASQYASVSGVFGAHKWTVECFVDNDELWDSYPNVRTMTIAASQPVVEVIDDITSWRPGDEVVLTSTDYDGEQAETAKVMLCTTCTSRQLQLDLEVMYTHYGEITDGVDMRGEVALLTRNILIQGEMETTCPPTNLNCDDFPYDTFGGQLKVLHQGFENVHIEGAEFYHMGQQTDLGSYPIHWHMCQDVDEVGGYSNPTYAKQNSIHHSFSRCVTIHGTNGATVMDNVGYNVLGHCYFEEDGGEKRTLFDGNLGAVIKGGSLTPSDDEEEGDPSVFWITNPQTTLRNNVAAGSVGFGFWFIFPDLPIGHTAEMGMSEIFMADGEARHTPLTEFTNNVAHSCGVHGLHMDGTLNEDGTIDGFGVYDPLVDPLDEDSPKQEVVLYQFTGYKNSYRNAWIRGGFITLDHASLSDSATGLTMARSAESSQNINASVIVGESDNIGEPSVRWDSTLHQDIFFSRALPIYEWQKPIMGITFYDGPAFVNNVWFNNFMPNDIRTSGALGFKQKNKYASSPVSRTQETTFGFVDGTSGNRVYDGDSTDPYGFADLDGDLVATFRDADGSVTGHPGAQVVKPRPFHLTDACYVKDNWKMAVCPYTFGKLKIKTYENYEATQAIVIRDDIPDVQDIMTGKRSRDHMVILGGTHSYTIHWTDFVPEKVSYYGRGFKKDFAVRIGTCLPLDATFDLYTYSPHWMPTKDRWTEVFSLTDLDADTTARAYFWDSSTGLLFVKLQHLEYAGPDEPYNCPGGDCPMFRVKLLSGTATDGNCISRAYNGGAGPYDRSPDTTTPSITDPGSYPSSARPVGLGAGSTKPFYTRLAIDGGWTGWGDWLACTEMCGGGTQTRLRSCSNPLPQNEGADCDGSNMESRDCNTDPCPIPGGWGSWVSGSCTSDGGGCYMEQTRPCDNPPPQHGGDYCSGYYAIREPCDLC